MPFLQTVNGLLPIALSIAIAAIGGVIASQVGLPMPYLLGAFLFVGAATLANVRIFGVRPNLPMPLRNVFVAVIGVMIGGNFHPGIFLTLGQIWLPALGVLLFVVVSLLMNYLLFRKVGGYDRPTAFFGAMPGGLIESIEMGERAGADTHILTLQQFTRISLVITSLPFIFLIWTGEKVGSAAGVNLVSGGITGAYVDWAVLALCAGVGLVGGRALRLPASILIGPMILSAAVHYFGLTQAAPPISLIVLAQMIVGAGLGARFRGFKKNEFTKVIALGLVSVALMLALDATIVIGLQQFLDLPFDVLLISFAPGGVTETALIALSLHANPVFVTTLHVFRILVTVTVSSVAFKWLEKRG
jgi:uncharacterized protein